MLIEKTIASAGYEWTTVKNNSMSWSTCHGKKTGRIEVYTIWSYAVIQSFDERI